jgi:hypothetical protein
MTGRVILKSLALFVLLNLLFAWLNPSQSLGRLTIYNRLVPGRDRLPYADDPSRSYSLSLYDLEVMLASHEINSGPKPADEFRVILIGDSSTWGYLLHSDQTLAAAINQKNLTLPDGRRVHAYNLGYPFMSLAKDLLILSRAMRYQPDMIVWPVTLESFPKDKQLFPPLLRNNPEPIRELIGKYNLNLDPNDQNFVEPSFLDRTILGSRRRLADWIRLQLYGLMWAATGIDQDLPSDFTPLMKDLPPDDSFHDLKTPVLNPNTLSSDVLEAGAQLAGDTPLLFVNEPMFISQGQNSDIRYNFYYPRWAYDSYRQVLSSLSAEKGWRYLDLWDAISPSEFTNTAVHMTPHGTSTLADFLGEAILQAGSEPR